MVRSTWTRRTGYSLMLQRNGIYYFRMAVPEPVRAILGKQEILSCLRTKDRHSAKRKLHEAATETERPFDAARRKHALRAKSPEVLALRWKHEALKVDLDAREQAPPRDEES